MRAVNNSTERMRDMGPSTYPFKALICRLGD